MQLTNGDLFWTDQTKIKNIYPYITENISCDVLIIGGGIGGAITAYYLAKENIDVVLVEKNIIGYGSTSASTAILEYQVDIELNKLEKMIGKSNAKKIYKLCYNAIDELEKISLEVEGINDFGRKDTLYFSNNFMQKASMQKESDARKEIGFHTNFIDKHDIVNLNSGILTKDSSAIINPYNFTQELIAYLNNFKNVRVFENTPVISVKGRYDDVECITNNKFKIKANRAIFCSGYETLKYVPNLPVELYKTFTIVSKPNRQLKRINPNFTARDSVEPYHYIRFTDDSRLVLGGEDIKITSKILDKSNLETIASSKYKKLQGTMQKLFNNIEDLEVEYEFNGTFGNTKDTLPIIDEIENMPNCFCNLGFGANGILYNVIGGNMLKNAVKGYFSKDMNMLKIDR